MANTVVNTGGAVALWLQEDVVTFTLWDMLSRMSMIGIAVMIVLAIMSMYSIAVMIERWLSFNAAKKQSREFAPKVAVVLRKGNIDEAINVSSKYKKSHLAMVVSSGLQEFQAHQLSTEIPGGMVDAAKRALQRAVAVKTAEFKRGLSSLATIGSTAPFVGLFGTVVGIVAAFQGIREAETSGIGAVAGGIAEALVATAFGIFVAVPAVWLFNYFTSRVDSFVVEMENSSSELIDYFLKQQGAG